MRKLPFEKNYPSISYIVSNWPKSKNILKKFILSNHKKPDLYKLCISCLRDLNVKKIGGFQVVLQKLSKRCLRNVTCNTYHNEHHYKAVIVISCLLAKLINLKNDDEKILLVIIALSHDLSHNGRRVSKVPYFQENKSFFELQKLLFKKIPNLKKNKRIHRIFRSTYFPVKPEKVDDKIEKIILDADILASLMFGIDVGIELAKRLKHEIRFEDKSDVLFSGFLSLLQNKSLYLESSKKILLKKY